MLCASLILGKAWHITGLGAWSCMVAERQAGRGPSEPHGPHCQPAWVQSRDGHPSLHPSSQPSRDTPGHCPQPARGWTQRPWTPHCTGTWPEEIPMFRPASRSPPVPSSNGPASSGSGPALAARGGEAAHRPLPQPSSRTHCCPPALSPLFFHMSLPPSSATTVKVSSLGSKNNPVEEDNLSQAALPC